MTMKAELWHRAKELYNSALERQPELREATGNHPQHSSDFVPRLVSLHAKRPPRSGLVQVVMSENFRAWKSCPRELLSHRRFWSEPVLECLHTDKCCGSSCVGSIGCN